MINKFAQFVSLLLVMMMVLCTWSVVSFAETQGSSILVYVIVDKERDFAQVDFDEVTCTDMIITSKKIIQNKIEYELMLYVLEDPNDAVDKLANNPLVSSVRINDKYGPFSSFIKLNQSIVNIEVGQSKDLFLSEIELIEDNTQKLGVCFKIDPSVFNEETYDNLQFNSYGVLSFWPNTEYGADILITQPDSYEGEKSNDNVYFGTTLDGNEFNVVNILSKTEGILETSIVQMEVPGGRIPYETWELTNDNASLTLSGGDVVPGFNENGPKLNQTASITGLTPGVSTLTVSRGGSHAEATSSCIIIISKKGNLGNPGDVDFDGMVKAPDALLCLQHSIGKIQLDAFSVDVSDVNDDGVITSADALIILQLSVGKY